MRNILTLLVLASLMSCSGPTKKENQTEKSEKMELTNKEKVEAFIAAVNANDAETAASFLTEDYIQHNPFIPTGREQFLGLFPILKENGTQAETQRIFVDGDYVVMHNIWKNADPFGASTMVSFDVLRIDENGKIAEHWDAMMADKPANVSGRKLTDGTTEVTDIDQTEENRAKGAGLFGAIESGDQDAIGAQVMSLFQPDYAQHNPDAGDGIEAVFAAFAEQQWAYSKNHKLLAQGNFVLSISEGSAKGIPSVFYDLIRFENGKIVEHWDVIQAIPSEGLANENGMFGF